MAKKDKLKILAIGDIHGDKGLVRKLAEKADKENVDLIILAGDLTFMEASVDGIIGPFVEKGKKVLLIPGNHESPAVIKFLTEKYSKTYSIHGYSFKIGDVGFFGSGIVDWGVDLTASKELLKQLKEGHEKIKDLKKKVMVTHMPPSESKAEFTGFKGSDAVLEALKLLKPNILISAHIHEAGGIEEKIGNTYVFHVSRKEKILEL